MERVHVTLSRHGLHRSGERLPEDLPTEHRAPAEVLALPAEQALFDLLERELRHELLEDLTAGERHRSPPRATLGGTTRATTAAARATTAAAA